MNRTTFQNHLSLSDFYLDNIKTLLMTLACQVIRCNHQPFHTQRVCKECGVYVFEGLKQYGSKTHAFFGTINDIPTLNLNVNFQQQTDIRPLRPETVHLVERVERELNLSVETLGLGLYLYFQTLQRESGNQNEAGDVGICLCLASKYLEHTGKKHIHKFRKYFGKTFEKEEYLQKEASILGDMSFDLNVVTFVDYLLHYLSRGGCFSSEMVDVSSFETSMLMTAKRVLYSGMFLGVGQEKLAATMLYQSRLNLKLFQPWNWHIEQYTGIPGREINKWVRGVRLPLNSQQH